MNAKSTLTAILVGLSFFGCIWLVANEMGFLSQVHNSGKLIFLLFVPAIIAGFYALQYVKKTFIGEDVIRYTGISFIFFLLVSEALGLYINRITSTNCSLISVTILDYQPIYVSGYGRMKSEALANKWSITLTNDQGDVETYVLNNKLSLEKQLPQQTKLNFCTSIFGFKMLKGQLE